MSCPASSPMLSGRASLPSRSQGVSVVEVRGVVSEPAPAFALGDAHIYQLPSRSEGAKVFQAMPEGDGTWRPGGAIAVPAAQPRDDPGGPGEAVPGVRVFLLLCFALD